MFQEHVSSEIRAELGRRHQSQRFLARVLGWTEVKLGRRLNGQVAWSTKEIEQVASVLGVPLAGLTSPNGHVS